MELGDPGKLLRQRFLRNGGPGQRRVVGVGHAFRQLLLQQVAAHGGIPRRLPGSGQGGALLPQVQQAAEAAKKPKKGLVSRVAKMMEEDDGNEIAGINALPPRVSKDEAYHPAKTPQKNGKRKR